MPFDVEMFFTKSVMEEFKVSKKNIETLEEAKTWVKKHLKKSTQSWRIEGHGFEHYEISLKGE